MFLVDGTPAGLRTAEIGLSTCKAVACPRASLTALRDRPEAKRTGVYVLIGEEHPDQPGRTAVYVGEGDEVMTRILRHENAKDFWDRVIIFVSKDENLTKSHVRHLEAKLVALAREANRAFVVNGNDPEGGRLPEAEEAEMTQFLEQVRILLGIFGISEFEPVRPRVMATPVAKKSQGPVKLAKPAFFSRWEGLKRKDYWTIPVSSCVRDHTREKLLVLPSLPTNIPSVTSSSSVVFSRRIGDDLKFTTRLSLYIVERCSGGDQRYQHERPDHVETSGWDHAERLGGTRVER
nr:GIY-YIG nuclease family protein [Nannocystis sp.]